MDLFYCILQVKLRWMVDFISVQHDNCSPRQFLFSCTPSHGPARSWVPVLPSLEEISPLLSLCLPSLAAAPAAGSEVCSMREWLQRHGYKWSLMRQLNVHPKGNQEAELAECILLPWHKGVIPGHPWETEISDLWAICRVRAMSLPASVLGTLN